MPHASRAHAFSRRLGGLLVLSCASIGGLASALALGGCASGPAPAATDPVASAQRLRGSWELLTLGGKLVEANTQKGERQPDLTVNEDNSVRGFAGVNSFSGPLDAKALGAGVFKAGPFITTRRAGPPGLMDLETRVLDALSNADAYGVSGSRLTLLRAGEAIAEFRRR